MRRLLFMFLFAIMLSCFAVPNARGYTLVQKNSNSGGTQVQGGVALQVSFPNPNAAGNLIIISAAWVNGGTASVSDSNGNAYSTAVGPPASGYASQIWYAANVAGGANTVTVLFSQSYNDVVNVFEYSGLATSSPLDATGSNTGNSRTLDTGSVTTTQSNELIFATGFAIGQLTAGTNYTLEEQTVYSTDEYLGGEDRVGTTAGAYDATFSDASSYLSVAQIATFNAAVATGTPTCGQASDGHYRLPSDWATFTGPSGGKGNAVADSSFGCTLTQITDSTTDCGTNEGIVVYYNTIEAFSADDKKVWMQCLNGQNEIVDWKTNYPTPYTVISPTQFPPAVRGVIFWDLTDGNSFYGTTSTSLVKYTLTDWPTCVTQASTCHFSSTTVKDFTTVGFAQGCMANAEPDISQDGKYLLLACQNTAGGNISMVLWNIANGTSDMTYVSTCTGSLDIESPCTTPNSSTTSIHKVQIAADDGMLLQFNPDCSGTAFSTCSGEQGLIYWNPSKGCASTNSPGITSLNGGQFQCRIQASTDHMDAGFDLNGNSIVGFDAAPNVYPGTNPCSTIGGNAWSGIGILLAANVLNTSNPTPNCPWGSTVLTPGFHIGYRGGASQPWILLSMFDTRTPGPEWFGTSSNYQLSGGQDAGCGNGTYWCPYEDEIVLARVDNNSLTGNGIWRLAHGYCRTAESFWNQCQASMSRDGKYIALTSSMKYGPTGCTGTPWNGGGAPNDCENVYIISAANGAPIF